MIKKLWPSIVLATLGLALLFTQFPFGLFQGHPASHNQAVITYYYIYDPVTGYATAKVTLYQDGCKVTENMEPSSRKGVAAIVSIFSYSGKFVGQWVCYHDRVKYWVDSGSAERIPLMAYSGSQIDDLLSARNKKRPSEKFFLF